MKSNSQKPDSDQWTVFLRNLSLLIQPVKEIVNGIRTNTLPWKYCAGWMALSSIILFFKLDHALILHSRFKDLYPYYPPLYRVYAFTLTTLGFWGWAWIQVRIKLNKLKTLTHAFTNAGLQSRIGRLPQLISDIPIDPMIRKLRLTNAGFPASSFREQSKFIEAELGVFIDDIKENREKRAVDIIYSHYPMPADVKYSQDTATRPFEVCIGRTRASHLSTSLRDTPHFLVAGQTGGGKSTFLRQFIVHLHLKHPFVKFLLIDLKGGLEFSLFEDRSQFHVVPNVQAAVEELLTINRVLEERMMLLKKHKWKDIDAVKGINLQRQVVVVDEAAEMFLAGHHAKAKEIQEARAILSRIARQGRAVGVHLVVATQRPDSRSLDPQVKANLTGVLCFQMMNDSSSIAVLGNGRATDLPKVPGRAIWKNGIEMVEVQTPLLTTEEAVDLLGSPNSVTQNTAKTETTASTTESKLESVELESEQIIYGEIKKEKHLPSNGT